MVLWMLVVVIVCDWTRTAVLDVPVHVHILPISFANSYRVLDRISTSRTDQTGLMVVIILDVLAMRMRMALSAHSTHHVIAVANVMRLHV